MNKQILIAGFGGQGILFAGKFIAYGGLYDNKEVTWLPSYGPEMRGGTANCSIIIGDSKIGSPIVDKPNILAAMNKPSLDKYIFAVSKGGTVFYDSSLITDVPTTENNITILPIPATAMASESGLNGLANMIMVGYMLSKCNLISDYAAAEAMKKAVSAKKQSLYEMNAKAIELGREYGCRTNTRTNA